MNPPHRQSPPVSIQVGASWLAPLEHFNENHNKSKELLGKSRKFNKIAIKSIGFGAGRKDLEGFRKQNHESRAGRSSWPASGAPKSRKNLPEPPRPPPTRLGPARIPLNPPAGRKSVQKSFSHFVDRTPYMEGFELADLEYIKNFERSVIFLARL